MSVCLCACVSVCLCVCVSVCLCLCLCLFLLKRSFVTIYRTTSFQIDDLFTGSMPDDTEEGVKAGLRTMSSRNWELNLVARQVGV